MSKIYFDPIKVEINFSLQWKKLEKIEKVVDKNIVYAYNSTCVKQKRCRKIDRKINRGEVLKWLKRRPC